MTNNKTSDMNEKKFEKLLRVQGADFSRWLGDDAANARALLESSLVARELYKQADMFERALNSFQAPEVPAGLAVRAANEALLQARVRKPVRRRNFFRLPSLRVMAPAGAGAFALAALLLVALPAMRDPADVNHFMNKMDKIASRSDQELKETDDVLGMLQVADADTQTPAAENGGVTSDELMKTLFGDGKDGDDAGGDSGANL